MEGIQWFTFELFKRITQAHPEHQFYFIFDRPFNKEFVFSKNVHPYVLKPQTRHPFLYLIWFHWQLPRFFKKHQIDAFISPDGFLPLKTKTPTLAVIHDINFEHFPKGMPFLYVWYYLKFFPKYAKIATRIVTVSHFSKADIIQKYAIENSKIDVVYNGINKSFVPISKEEQIKTRQKFTKGKPYFLFVGSLHPRKNLPNLLKAFEKYKQIAQNETQLLVVGSKLFKTKAIFKAYNQMIYRENVHFCGHLFEYDLHKVTASAKALTFVSYFEGFGIPIVEAFACQTPVITSKTSSMPEIAGDAAILINPHSTDEIAQALQKMDNEHLRLELIEKGKIRSKDFDWNISAQKLWENIEEILPK
jgi:glycosyltransferase involved in cell wall biosynthesis